MNLIPFFSLLTSTLIGIGYSISALERVESANQTFLKHRELEHRARNCARFQASLKNNNDACRFLIKAQPHKRVNIVKAKAEIEEELLALKEHFACDTLVKSGVHYGVRRISNSKLSLDWPNWLEKEDFSDLLLRRERKPLFGSSQL